MSRFDLAAIPETQGSTYPAPHDAACKNRRVKRLAQAAGLTQLGASQVRLPPGAWSSQRHWHAIEDELAVVLEGEVVLVTDEGEEVLRGRRLGRRHAVLRRNRHHPPTKNGTNTHVPTIAITATTGSATLLKRAGSRDGGHSRSRNASTQPSCGVQIEAPQEAGGGVEHR